MRSAWLLGVFLLTPGAGFCAPAPTPRELSDLLNSGELPPIKLVPASPRPRRARPPAPAAALPAPLLPHPLSEVERLGEELRDAVRPLPTLEEFLRAVRDPDPRGRAAAVAAFGYEGNFAAIPYVSAVLLRLDEPLAVRTAAARALGRIGDRRARSFLSRALRGARDEPLREALQWALGAARSRF
jgi:HEAT repeat protein